MLQVLGGLEELGDVVFIVQLWVQQRLVRSLDRAIIDEIQRAPQLLLAIRASMRIGVPDVFC